MCRYLELSVNTFGGNLQFAALGNLDSLHGLVARSSLEVLDLVNDVVALEDFAENDVAAIQPARQRILGLNCLQETEMRIRLTW